jgi:large subunit ribosomal protein L9
MKIILLEDVRNVGKKFDVKDVSDGYARNFLFPGNLAEPATVGALKKIEAMKATHEKEDKEIRAHLETIAKKISETKIEFELKADKSGAIFGSVNKESILKALREHHFVTKERVDIDLKYPIKELGEYVVPVDLKKGVVAELKILVVRQKS